MRVVPDLAADPHGGRPRPARPRRLGRPATAPSAPNGVLAWLGELLEQTCPEPPVLVGRGLGGAVAARFAAGHGDRVLGLVLVGAFGLAPFDPAPAFGQAMQRFAEEPTADTRDGLFRQCFVDLDGLAGQLGERWAAVADYALDRARHPGDGGRPRKGSCPSSSCRRSRRPSWTASPCPPA